MKKLGIRGEMNILLIVLTLVVLILFGTGGFAYWAYSNMTKYRYHADQVAAAAVKAANTTLTKQLNNQFAEKEKNPYKVYTGPSTYGSLHITYPKTWSAFMSVNNQSDTYMDGYFYPDVIPNTSQTDSSAATVNFALRVQVLQGNYADILGNYQGQTESGIVQVQPYHLPQVPTVIGSEITGQIQDNKTGTLIILPVRNYTLEIWTEGTQFLPDFTNIILPNFTFSP